MTKSEIVRMAYEAGCPSIIVPAEWFKFAKLVAAAEREKLTHELLTLEKWKGLALAKDGDGRTVQEIEREARAAQRVYCSCGDGIVADDGALCGTCVSLKDAVKQEPVAWMTKDGEAAITGNDPYDQRSPDDLFCVPLYTAPPQREWQGLTGEEIGTVIADCNITLVNYCSEEKQTEFAGAIEAKLKEKNT
jgi:hypothetical protein